MRIGAFVFMLLCILSAACRSDPPAPKGTGARESAAKFLDALVKKDWDAAYGQLHATTRKQIGRAEFERRALVYGVSLGFPLSTYVIRSCDEQGAKAIAHVTLSDANHSAKHRYREGIVLQSTDGTWAIVLPANFGKR